MGKKMSDCNALLKNLAAEDETVSANLERVYGVKLPRVERKKVVLRANLPPAPPLALIAKEGLTYRVWTTDNGKFLVTALYLGVSHRGEVVLRKRDGKEVAVPLGQLSEADRKYIDAASQ